MANNNINKPVREIFPTSIRSNASPRIASLGPNGANRNEEDRVIVSNHNYYQPGSENPTPPSPFELAEWIKTNIHRRVCIRPIFNKEQICQCGHDPYDNEDDRHRDGKGEAGVWYSSDKFTNSVPTNAFGEIEFTTSQNIAKYIRVGYPTRPPEYPAGLSADEKKELEEQRDDVVKKVVELLLQKWCLPRPNIIISVTGGAGKFDTTNIQQRRFKRGIIRAAEKTGAWLITGGSFAGVMKHVGKAMRDFGSKETAPIPLIGVSPWGRVDKRVQLTQEGKRVKYTIAKGHKEKTSDPDPDLVLDENHTHFILVDNGTQRLWQTEIDLRTRLEAALTMQAQKDDSEQRVMLVLVVVGGGPGTLQTVCNAITRSTPVVLVTGMGLAADLIASVYRASATGSSAEQPEPPDESVTPDERIPGLQKKELDALKETTKNIKNGFMLVKQIMEKRELITIFDSSGEFEEEDDEDIVSGREANNASTSESEDLDSAILRALVTYYRVHTAAAAAANPAPASAPAPAPAGPGTGAETSKGAPAQAQAQQSEQASSSALGLLRLAVSWDRLDMAREYIFKHQEAGLDDAHVSHKSEVMQLKRKDYLKILPVALRMDRSEFVGEFIERGLKFAEFIHFPDAIDNLAQLYSNDFVPHHQVVRKLLHEREAEQVEEAELAKLELPEQQRVNAEAARTLLVIGHLLSKTLIGDSRGHPYCEVKLALEQAAQGLKPIDPNSDVLPEQQKHALHQSTPSEYQVQIIFDPALDVFLWAILLDRKEMAEVLLEHLRESLAAPLLACCLLRNLAEEAEATQPEASKKMQETAASMEELALTFVNVCAREDERRAEELLVREVPALSGRTPLELAYAANAIKFIANDRCQAFLDRVWYGHITKTQHRGLLIFLALLCPPLLFLLDYQAATNEESQSKEKIEGESDNKQEHEGSDHRRRHHHHSDEPVSCLNRIAYFYNAPVIVFWNHVFLYGAFLLLFLYFVIWSDLGFSIDSNPLVIVMIIWVFAFFIEEIRRLVRSKNGILFEMRMYWGNNFTNVLNLVALLLFVPGVVFLNIIPVDASQETQDPYLEFRVTGSVCMACSWFCFAMRVLHFYAINKNLGPWVLMVSKLLMNLIKFFSMILIVMIGWGVCEYALLFPHSTFDKWLPYNILAIAYWQLHGELKGEVLNAPPYDMGAECSTLPEEYDHFKKHRCSDPSINWLVILLLLLYLFVTNILLFNLLIAIFANSYEEMQDDNEEYWCFLKYQVIIEYNDKPPLPPPFNLLHFFLFLPFRLFFPRLLDGYSHAVANRFKQRKDRIEQAWMMYKMGDFFKKRRMDEAAQVDERAKRLPDSPVCARRVQKVHRDILRLEVALKRLGEDADSKLAAAKKNDLLTLMTSDARLEDTNVVIKEMLRIVKQINTSARGAPAASAERAALAQLESAAGGRGRWAAAVTPKAKVAIGLLHKASLVSPYPGSQVERQYVPTSKISWKALFPNYSPPSYTSRATLSAVTLSDPDSLPVAAPPATVSLAAGGTPRAGAGVRAPAWNAFDPVYGCLRTSFGALYHVRDGFPVNPRGRTGLRGRGNLPRWGPNLAEALLVTRWRKIEPGSEFGKDEESVLEVLAFEDKRTHELFLPFRLYEDVGETLLDSVSVGLVAEIESRPKLAETGLRQLYSLLDRTPLLVYKGYLDDPRNTDNAWVEVHCVNIHEESCDAGASLSALAYSDLPHVSLRYELGRAFGRAMGGAALDTALLSLMPSSKAAGGGGGGNIAHLRALWVEAYSLKLGETPAAYKLLWELARLHKTRLPL